MISPKMEEALNAQIQLEAHASFLYLSMASWCDKEGLEGSAKFMHRQSAEEREHMLKIFEYLSEVDGHALVPAIHPVSHEFESIKAMFQEVYAHEKKVTASINKLMDIAKKENDYTTDNFLQWYIMEQREEENQMRTLLDKIKLIGEGPMTLYYIDKEVASLNQEEMAEEEEEAVMA
ncbi:MAG: ferritin [Bacteroidota bacterium]